MSTLPSSPKLRYPAYSAYKPLCSNWPVNIPAHWGSLRLKYIALTQLSNVDKKTVDGEIPVRLCNYVDVYKNDFITADIEFMQATATENQVASFTLKAGDVL